MRGDGAAIEQVISNGGDGGSGGRGEGSWETYEYRDAMKVGGTARTNCEIGRAKALEES